MMHYTADLHNRVIENTPVAKAGQRVTFCLSDDELMTRPLMPATVAAPLITAHEYCMAVFMYQ